jgi:ketosteroid isomerase-like protein
VDILRKVRTIESTIARQFDSAAKKLARTGAREPLEIVHAILDAVDRQFQRVSRGGRVFPFNRIRVSVLAPSRDARGRLETVLAGDYGLRRRIADKLRSAGCDDSDIAVAINYVGRAQKNWGDPEFHVTFATVEVPALESLVPPSCPPRLEITVLQGVTAKRTYAFVADRIDIGRCVEVKDNRGRLIRTNNIAFVEGALDVNQSVSRQHAHITYQSTSRDFRLYDDGSAHGTHIVRGGTTVTVPRGSRGVRLKSGDEIAAGDARMRIRINAAPADPLRNRTAGFEP